MTITDKNRIESFLKECKTTIEPPITDSIVYDKLTDYGLQDDDFKDGKPKKIEPLFQKWSKIFQDNLFHKHNYSLYRFPKNDWFGFRSKNLDGSNHEWYKIYISITSQYLEESVIQIAKFLDKNVDFEYDMKIANTMRSDNIVIRIRKEADALIIIDFIKNNPTIMKGLNPNNPFIPNTNGVNIIKDNGGSYNNFLSFMISDYLNKNSLEQIDYSTFLEHLKTAPVNHNYINDMEEHFGYQNSLLHKPVANNETKLEPQVSPMSQQEEVEKILNYKKEVLFNAALQNYIKYQSMNLGYKQLFFALQRAIESGNYDGFTNNSGSRDLLSSFIAPQEIISIMLMTLNTSNPNQDINTIIDFYIKYIQKEYLEFLKTENSLKNK